MRKAKTPITKQTDSHERDAEVDSSQPNTQQLRARIPSARTAKVDSAHEPAAAPFDTDDEAAGRPAQDAAIRQALAHEDRAPSQRQGSAGSFTGFLTAIVIVGAIVAFVVLFWIAVG